MAFLQIAKVRKNYFTPSAMGNQPPEESHFFNLARQSGHNYIVERPSAGNGDLWRGSGEAGGVAVR